MNDSRPEAARVPQPGGYREVLRMAFPLIISTGSFSVMQFVDRVFLAQYSSVSIQAALPAGLLAFTLVCAFMAIAGYANTFVAQYYGGGDPRGCSRATMQAVWISLLSWPVIFALIPVGRLLLVQAGHAPEVLAEELDYLRILMAGGVAIPLGAAISSFFTGRGDTLTNMYAQIAGNIANIALDYALIFGRWGLPELGIRGAGYATVIAQFVPPLILFALYFTRGMDARFHTRSTVCWDGALVRRMLRFGVPAGIQLFLDVSSFSVFVLMTGSMGALPLAVSNIALSINTLAFMPLIGISIAASTLVGQYQGRGDSATAELAGWNALRVGFFYMAGMASAYLLAPSAFFALFAERGGGGFSLAELMSLGRYMLMMMAAWGLLDAINLILSGALKGAGDTKFVMWYTVLAGWGLIVPGQYVIVYLMNGGILLSWAWLAFVIMVMSLGFVWRFRRGAWKRIRLIEPSGTRPPPQAGAEAWVLPE